MILCDTNILIEFYKNNRRITDELRRIDLAELGISFITEAELYYGAINKRELNEIKRHLHLLHRLPLDEAISVRFLELIEGFALSHKLSLPDGLIASTALVHGLELYTLNERDFRFIPGLKLYQPVTYE
jgi:predicted nucleic acid-binding protein